MLRSTNEGRADLTRRRWTWLMAPICICFGVAEVAAQNRWIVCKTGTASKVLGLWAWDENRDREERSSGVEARAHRYRTNRKATSVGEAYSQGRWDWTTPPYQYPSHGEWKHCGWAWQSGKRRARYSYDSDASLAFDGAKSAKKSCDPPTGSGCDCDCSSSSHSNIVGSPEETTVKFDRGGLYVNLASALESTGSRLASFHTRVVDTRTNTVVFEGTVALSRRGAGSPRLKRLGGFARHPFFRTMSLSGRPGVEARVSLAGLVLRFPGLPLQYARVVVDGEAVGTADQDDCTLAPLKIGAGPARVLGPSSRPGSVFAGLTPAVVEVRQHELRPQLDSQGARVHGEFHFVGGVIRQGVGDSVLVGVIDTAVNPWTFRETTTAELPHLGAGVIAATMTPDLLTVVIETGGPVRYSHRPSTTLPFPAFRNFGNLTGLVDSKLYRRDGKIWYAYVQSETVNAVEIDPARYPADPMVGSPSVLVDAEFSTRSLEPLLDGDGNARALLFSGDTGTGSRARPWFLSDLETGDGALPFHREAAGNTELTHPTVIGGSCFYVTTTSSGTFSDPTRIDLVCSSGGNAPTAGGPIRLSAWLPYLSPGSGAAPWTTWILIGSPCPSDLFGVGRVPWRGQLAIDTAGLVMLPPQTWGEGSVSADWTWIAPPAPAGTVMSSQVLAVSPGSGMFTIGNTASITWR